MEKERIIEKVNAWLKAHCVDGWEAYIEMSVSKYGSDELEIEKHKFNLNQKIGDE